MKLKLKLQTHAVSFEPEPETGGSLRFPVRAVRSLPNPSRAHARREESQAPVSDRDVMRHPELIRQIEATLDRMQAGVDQLNEHVNNYKFPGAEDEERPRAA